MKPAIFSLLLFSLSANATMTCPSNQIWVEMNCSLCQEGETCLTETGGCCPNYKVSPTMDVCCDYISFDGKCVYHGGKCPDGYIWDKTSESCISVTEGCGSGRIWNGNRCCKQ